MNPSHFNNLDNPTERACARLAAQARWDTINGGALAMVIASTGSFGGNDPEDQLPFDVPGEEIVSDVYSASTGKHSERWEAWECPECGDVRLGQEAARQCCDPDFELCSRCTQPVSRDDPYFSTPCGTYCETCLHDHACECDVCAKEFGLHEPDDE